jgi:hypothetical protein
MSGQRRTVRRGIRLAGVAALVVTMLVIAGCSGNVGVGISVGVPVGNYGYMSVGTTRWY